MAKCNKSLFPSLLCVWVSPPLTCRSCLTTQTLLLIEGQLTSCGARFVAICDRCAQEFGPSPCVSSADSIDLRNHHIWFTLPQWNYKSRLVICTPARLIELNKPPSFFCPPERIDGKERLVPEIYKSWVKEFTAWNEKWKTEKHSRQNSPRSICCVAQEYVKLCKIPPKAASYREAAS